MSSPHPESLKLEHKSHICLPSKGKELQSKVTIPHLQINKKRASVETLTRLLLDCFGTALTEHETAHV